MATVNAVTLDHVLSQVAIRYRNRAMLAPQIAPIISVKRDRGKYPVFGLETFEAIEALRAPGAEPTQINWTVSWQDYITQSYALSDVMPDEIRDNAETELNIESAYVQGITNALDVSWEKRIAAKIYDTSIWANADAAAKWTNAAADPLTQIEDVLDASDLADFNTIIMGKGAWKNFRRHPNVLAALASTERKRIDLATAKDLTGIENWLIGGAWLNSAPRGKTAVLQRIWGDDKVWIGRIAPTPGPNELSALYTIRDKQFEVYREYNGLRKATTFAQYYSQTEHVCCSKAGYLLTAVA